MINLTYIIHGLIRASPYTQKRAGLLSLIIPTINTISLQIKVVLFPLLFRIHNQMSSGLVTYKTLMAENINGQMCMEMWMWMWMRWGCLCGCEMSTLQAIPLRFLPTALKRDVLSWMKNPHYTWIESQRLKSDINCSAIIFLIQTEIRN